MIKNERKMDENMAAEGVAWYRKKIIDMVELIENERYLKMIYGYTNSAYREEKSRG